MDRRIALLPDGSIAEEIDLGPFLMFDQPGRVFMYTNPIPDPEVEGE
jgi:hypothetical protein